MRMCCWVALIMWSLSGVVLAETIREKMPENQTLKSGEVVYVQNDGRCQAGKVLRVTGGHKSRGVKRQVACVAKPD